MKQLVLIVVTAFLLTSCKKDSVISETPAQGTLPEITAGRNPTEDCGYIPLTLNAQGQWQAIFGNVIVKFSNLHIFFDGRLYGKLESAQTCILETGHEGIPSREFAFSQITCQGSGSISKEVTTQTYTDFNTLSNNNSTYGLFFNNGTFTSGSQFGMYALSHLITGVTYVVNPTNATVTYQQTKYTWNTPFNCTNNVLTAGKLVAKNVVQLQNGTFTYSEFGIAPLCYVDQPVSWYITQED